MVGSDQIIIDEVKMGVHIILNKIGEIFQDVFVGEVNRLIYVAVNEHRDGCKMDDLSQLHHTCLTMDAQEQPVAKMMRHSHGKTTFLASSCSCHRSVKYNTDLPPPSHSKLFLQVLSMVLYC